MPKQNRVTPFGKIITTTARGTLMGNRGTLHNAQQEIIKLYDGSRWIYCQLKFKDYQHPIMEPNKRTALFFLDEATAYAAGHRPCGFCQRKRQDEFLKLWQQANPELASLSIKEIDKHLHAERVDKNKQKITYFDQLANLPVGTFIALENQPYVVLADELRLWQPGGYTTCLPRPANQQVEVLTPRSMVRTLAQGFKVEVNYDRLPTNLSQRP